MGNKNEKPQEKLIYRKPEIVSLDDTNSLAGQQPSLCMPTGSGADACGTGSQAVGLAPTPSPAP